MGSRMRGRIVAGVISSIALCAMASTIALPAASAAEGTYYSSKQPYREPSQQVLQSYSAAPQGYETISTQVVARHGSRGLSSYKYDALLLKMGETAQAEGGFVSDEIGEEFMANIRAIIAANVENGYGMLTGQGATQHQGIGERAYERNKGLFDSAAAQGQSIAYESSGESRATESGENFKLGFDSASGNALANSALKANNPAGSGAASVFEKSPDTLYFHKVKNPDGSTKQGLVYDIAQQYTDFIDGADGEGNAIISAAMDYIESKGEDVSRALLSQIFTTEFLDNIGKDKGQYSWYNTSDGKKHADKDGDGLDDKSGQDINLFWNDAPGADISKDKNARGDMGKKIISEVDAAMDLYNLYIIAADMQEENTGSHTFDFDQYFEHLDANTANVFAWILDAEDFYEKGPGYEGQRQTYSIAQPLLDDFFASIDKRVAGGTTAATFRFAHAETIMPFAALIKAVGSEQQAPAVADPQSDNDVFTYQNNAWRGENVTPMAANIQWDVAARSGTDPHTGKAYTPVVRMLYNEQEITFHDGCVPVVDGSYWYKESELKRCLGMNSVSTSEDPRIVVDTNIDNGQGQNNSENDGQTTQGNASNTTASDAKAGQHKGRPSSRLADTGASVSIMVSILVTACIAGAMLMAVQRRMHGNESTRH